MWTTIQIKLQYNIQQLTQLGGTHGDMVVVPTIFLVDDITITINQFTQYT